jgi:hypothetical protein
MKMTIVIITYPQLELVSGCIVVIDYENDYSHDFLPGETPWVLYIPVYPLMGGKQSPAFISFQ